MAARSGENRVSHHANKRGHIVERKKTIPKNSHVKKLVALTTNCDKVQKKVKISTKNE